jgi:uncharacterized protein (TIRG00374 family)
MLRAAIGFVVSAVFIYLVARQISLPAVEDALARADSRWILAALALVLSGFILRGVRWWVMVRILAWSDDVRFRACLGPFFVSYGANNVLPLRAGDALRVVAFRRSLRCSSSRLLGTLVVERVLDLLVLLLLGCGASLALRRLDLLQGYASLLQLLALVAIAGAALILIAPVPAIAFLDLVDRKASLAKSSFGARIMAAIRDVLVAIDHICARRRLPYLLTLSIAAWVAEGAGFVCVAYGFATGATPATGFFVYVMGNLTQILPGAPGNFGLFEYFALQGLVHLSGVAPSLAAAIALLAHLVIWMPVTVIGAAYLLVIPALRPTTVTKAGAQAVYRKS